ncbi:MAG: family 20 glycosylhydrolase [Candidatus Cloacimonetes bacterium]|jgi:hexosaminidase|nr:family 20 glycosylhydrolase [Candidatus Cloacimonadota bacterium]MBT4332704.1 family 20 glycosylhydrolase [Candidatus Cloacimonadota bacterium]
MNIIPQPIKILKKIGSYKLDKTITVKHDDDHKEIIEVFNKKLQKITDLTIEFTNKKEADLKLIIDSQISNSEGYEVVVNSNGIIISASKKAGLFYGCITLLQIISETNLPFCEIEDEPRFEWRGMHLDVSRHFFPIEFIKRYIDLLSLQKLNVFHWHLTDDNGWRIEIKKYPQLTEVCSWRKNLEHISWNERNDSDEDGKGIYSGFYTQEEIKDVIKYAAERFITVVPEIEMPGHTSEVFAAFPQLSCREKKLEVAPGGYWPNLDIFCAGKEETFSFLEDILSEVIQLFPSPYIHIGGDEADKTRWKECLKCQKRIVDENLKDENELQSYFIKRITKFLMEKGKIPIGWDEIIEGGLAKDIVVMCWRGDGKDALENAISSGNKAILCPNPILYFDWKQNEDSQGAFGVTTLKQVHDYEPEHAGISNKDKHLIFGVQANVWTEWMPTSKEVEFMAFPRMSALAEVAWLQKNNKNWKIFLSRLTKFRSVLDKYSVNYYKETS